MSVIGIDSRASTSAFNTFPLSVVTTVDVGFQEPWGSGIAIGSGHVLSAGHVGFDTRVGGDVGIQRVVLSGDEDALVSRRIGNAADPGANVTNKNYLKGYDTLPNREVRSDDIVLYSTNDLGVAASDVIGLISFIDPKSASGLSIDTAGYPGDINNGRDLVQSPSGTISSARDDGRMFYSIDTAGGQSGSGVWHTLDGDSAPRVLGVHTHGTGVNAIVGALTFAKNGGTLITQDVYHAIADQMRTDIGSGFQALAADLPENAIVGTESSLFGGATGDDIIVGSWRRERLIGESGEDLLVGGGGDDRIEGGEGVDRVGFEGVIKDYEITVVSQNPDAPIFEIKHTGGDQSGGTDRVEGAEFAIFEFDDDDPFGATGHGVDDDGDVLFVPLKLDENDPSKLADGQLLKIGQDVKDANGDIIASLSAELPAFSWDGDIDFSLNLGAEQSFVFNFVYIVDSSGSMSGQNITETKAAYSTLTQSLIDTGVAARSQFAVVDFDSSARLFDGLDAQGAISTVNSLFAGGGTNFGPALQRGEEWFESLGNIKDSTNIAFFLSDGFGSGASTALQRVNEGTADEAIVDVRAFGIGLGADLQSLNIIDSNNAVLLTDPADLTDAFSVSGVDVTTIDRVEAKLDGVVVGTFGQNDFADGPLGLELNGSINGLEVSRDAMNRITLDVIFNDGTPTATIEAKVTTGQKELRQDSADGTKTFVTLSVNQLDYIIQGNAESVFANDLSNTITIGGGVHTLEGGEGDDRFIINGGETSIDGGGGVDTAVFNVTQADAGGVARNGDIVTVGDKHTFVDVEFIEFTDGRINAETLRVTPIVTLGAVEVSEATGMATITATFSSALTDTVSLTFGTRDDTATAGADYQSSFATAFAQAGDTEVTFDIEIDQDTDVEEAEQLIVDASISGDATFEDGSTQATTAVQINDDDSVISLTLFADDRTIREGSDGSVATSFELERFGDLTGEDVIAFTITGTGENAADASDFTGGALSGQVTFAAGEDNKKVSVAVQGDSELEQDETFQIEFTSVSGGSTIAADAIEFTILDDDSNATDGDDRFVGTAGDDVYSGLAGNDTIIGKGGNDTLRGNEDNDVIRGGGGADRLIGNAGADVTNGGGGKDIIRGGGGKDKMKGNGGADNMKGGGGKDIMKGGGGNDKMKGGGGADEIAGDRGNDVLTGNGGRDTFVFSANNGRDRITDRAANEKIQIKNGAESIDDLTLTQVGADVEISFTGTTIVVVTDNVANFDQNDFIF